MNHYDGNEPLPHPHLFCIRCKRIVDPEVPGLGSLPQNVGDSSGFTIVSHRLEFYGICPSRQD